MTEGSAVGVSSLRLKARPTTVLTPSVAKKSPETSWPLFTIVAAPFPLTSSRGAPENAARPEKRLLCERTSCKNGKEREQPLGLFSVRLFGQSPQELWPCSLGR